MYILYIILVGLVAGWATGKIMKGSGYGVLTDILLGIAGAIIGSRLLGLFGIYSSGGIVPRLDFCRWQLPPRPGASHQYSDNPERPG